MIICTNPAKKRSKEITKDSILNRPIQQLYKLNISIFMYKSFHKQLPSAFNNIFQRKTSTVITRSNSQIIPISCKNTVTKQSIRYIGPKIWNELPEKLKTVYYALIYSYLQYCVSKWGLASTTALDPLVRIHKRIIRIITNSPFLSHTNLLFQKLNFLKIKDIVKLEMAKTMFCFNKNSTKNESQTIVSITQKHHYKTRLAAQQNYFQPRKRTELGKKTFSYIGPKVWQEVPFELKSLSYNQFKKKFKLFLTCQY